MNNQNPENPDEKCDGLTGINISLGGLSTPLKPVPETEEAIKDHELIIGIDLGTTNSLVAYCTDSGPEILEAEPGQGVLPSVVRLPLGDGKPVIGKAAKDHAVEFPENTIFSVKRFIGRGINDLHGELDYLPYQLVQGTHDTARVKVANVVYYPEEISAMILRELKTRAETALGRTVKKAVVTVPAYFDDAQRQATRDAGRLAGLDVVRMVNEPTAAALAYDLDRSSEALIAVYDLGGGTFDVSILQLSNGVFQVLATAGDTHLGGDDIDRALVELIQTEIRQQFGENLSFPPAIRQAFRSFAEATKIRLSNEDNAEIEIELGADKTYSRSITREELEAMVQPVFEKTLEACKRALKDAEVQPSDIDHVVMVGGSTRIPLIRREIGHYFQTTPYTALNPDTVVALGASVQAAVIAGVNREALLLDVIPLSLGIETLGGAVAKLIVRNTNVPCSATERFSTYVDGQTNIKFNVYQGERELTEDCRLLSTFELRGIPPMPAGLPKILVTFQVDTNGILTVSAIEERSEKRARIQIIPNHGLTRQEVERIENESLEFALQDMTAHQLIDLRNQAKLDIRQIQKQITKVADEIDPDYQKEIEQKIAVTQTFLDSDTPDPGAFNEALTEMDHATIALAELAIAKTLRDEGQMK